MGYRSRIGTGVVFPYTENKLETMHLTETHKVMRQLKDELVRDLSVSIAKAIKEALANVVVSSSSGNPNSTPLQQSSGNKFKPIEIDESVHVVKADTSDFQKKFEEISETKLEEDSTIKSSTNKLRNLKQR